MLRRALVSAASGARRAAVQTRGFAAEAEIEPPLKLYGLPGRYASALFVAAAKANALPTVETELNLITSMANKDATFAAFLGDPTQTKAAKRKGITALLEEGKFSDTTKNFFAVLADNGRLGETRYIAEKYEELLMASRGEIKGQVTSAEPLTAEEFNAVKAACEKLLEKGQRLNLKAVVRNQVNPGIIGGLVVDIGDRHVDLSLNNQIRKMEALLLESVSLDK